MQDRIPNASTLNPTPDSAAISEARATLRAVADRIELDLAPLSEAAETLREAARTAPNLIPPSEDDPDGTVEGWCGGAVAYQADEIRQQIDSLRKLAEADFAEELRESYAEDSEPLRIPPPPPEDAEAAAVVRAMDGEATRETVQTAKFMISIFRSTLEKLAVSNPPPNFKAKFYGAPEDKVRAALDVLGIPATPRSLDLGSHLLRPAMGESERAA